MVQASRTKLRARELSPQRERTDDEDRDAVDFQVAPTMQQFVTYGSQSMRGIRTLKGKKVDPPKPLDKEQLIPHLVSGSLTKFYHIASHKPPVGAAISGKLSEIAKKDIASKEVRMPRTLLDHILEGFMRVQDIGNYLEWMLRGLKKSGALEGSNNVARAIVVSIRQAMNNLNSTSAVCNANVTSFRCQEVISALRTNLLEDALRKLWDAPFASRELRDNEVFNQVLKETRETPHDNVLLEPVRQKHHYHHRHSSYSSYRSGDDGSSGQRHRYQKSSGRGSRREDFHGGSSGHKDSSFRERHHHSGDKSTSSHSYRPGGQKKGGHPHKSGGG